MHWLQIQLSAYQEQNLWSLWYLQQRDKFNCTPENLWYGTKSKQRPIPCLNNTSWNTQHILHTLLIVQQAAAMQKKTILNTRYQCYKWMTPPRIVYISINDESMQTLLFCHHFNYLQKSLASTGVRFLLFYQAWHWKATTTIWFTSNNSINWIVTVWSHSAKLKFCDSQFCSYVR